MTCIISYTYDADVHCLSCTRVAMTHGRFRLPLGRGPFARDEHGLLYGLTDRERNVVLPVYDDDEQFGETRCGDCGALVSTGEPA